MKEFSTRGGSDASRRGRTGRVQPSYVNALLVCACGAGMLLPGCSRSPDDPTPGPTVMPISGSGHMITGTVADVIRGSAIGGISVAIDQNGSATTDASGRFALQTDAPNGRYRATLSGPDVITRQTTVSLPPDTLAFTLIPSTFDIGAFDQFARSLGGGAIIRWSSAPALIVETSLVAAPANDNAALADQIPSSESDRVINRLSQVLPLMTGSTFTGFSSVTRHTTPAGQAIPMYSRGAITVVYYTESNGACGQAGPRVAVNTFEIIAGAIWLKLGCASIASNTTTMVHELGHALGYGHVSSPPSVMAPTGGIDITAFDAAASVIVARRPAGNRSPDTDPDTTGTASTRSLAGRVMTPAPLP